MMSRILVAVTVVLFLVLAAALFIHLHKPASGQVSRFGKYHGYSYPEYDGYERRSDYLILSDGTRLAYDLLLPVKDGAPADEPLPTLFMHTTYLRASQMMKDGRVAHADFFGLSRMARAFIWTVSRFNGGSFIADQTMRDPWLKEMLKHGYVVIVVEASGTGASEGLMNAAFRAMAAESNEILDWIAAQSWSNGRIGMFGKSFTGMTQYAAASSGNPHLKAIFPVAAGFDLYDSLIYPGGIFNQTFGRIVTESTAILETMAVPVDGDDGQEALAKVLDERRQRFTLNQSSDRVNRNAPYRDSASPHPKGGRLWEDMGLYTLLDRINDSGVAVYNAGGWLDIFTRDTLLWHRNLTGPRKLVMLPRDHAELGKAQPELDLAAEAHRWFDYWLKGIDNGVMDEPRVRYYVMGGDETGGWRTADQWPPPEAARVRFFLSAGRSGSVESGNDGSLISKHKGAAGADLLTVDHAATSGRQPRWGAIMKNAVYPDMRTNDERSLTYTTPPLAADTEMKGHPVLRLWVAAGIGEADVFAYLEDVGPDGRSTYVTEGVLRASHRKTRPAPFDNMGLPYQRCYEADVSPAPEMEPVELVFDLLPLARIFKKGHCIRLTLAGADAANFDRPETAAAGFQVLRGPGRSSHIELPVMRPPRS